MNSELASAPVSGRRRAAPPGPKGSRGRLRLAAAVVVLAGMVLLLVGGLRATVLAPSSTSRATLVSPGQPVITTAVGLLGLDGPRVRADVTDGSRRPVFIGIGRAADVDAYLARAARLDVTGTDGDGRLLVKRLGTEPSVPDPAGVDVWVTSVRGTGTADLTWPDAPGQWRMLIATDGTAQAPSDLSLTWSGREVHSRAPMLIAIGLILLVAGSAALVLLSPRTGRGAGT